MLLVGDMKTKKAISADFKWDQLENALDFIDSGLERVSASKTKVDLKYGLLHLSSGVELLFKERLRREHWSLIFRDPDKASLKALESGDFESVDFKSCLKRLKDVAKVDLSPLANAELLRVRQKRNRLEHFGIIDSSEAIVASSVRLTSIVVDFIQEELQPKSWDKQNGRYLKRIIGRLSSYKKFVAVRMKEIRPSLNHAAEHKTVFVCPECEQRTLILDDHVACLFCKYTATAEDAADYWVQTVLGISHYEVAKEGGEFPLYDCPECDRATLVDTGEIGDMVEADRYYCLACGEVYKESSMRHCDNCGNLYHVYRNDELGMCSVCIDNMLRKD